LVLDDFRMHFAGVLFLSGVGLLLTLLCGLAAAPENEYGKGDDGE
jgi:hypothetical protein